MKSNFLRPVSLLVAVLILVSLACSAVIAAPTATPVPPSPTQPPTSVPTDTPQPTATLEPTATPDIAATQQMESLQAEVQSYYDKGYLNTTDGRFIQQENFKEEWAQIGWYQWWTLDQQASDFFMSAHFKWSTALQTSDVSGCGFVFAIQDNDDHYAVFLDKSRILFLYSKQAFKGAREVGKTRGTGRVSFGNPAEADFTLIVKDASAYVLVNNDMIGQYSLSKDAPLQGSLGLTLLSGTNRDYGTRCEMTDLHLWIPNN